MPAPVCEIGPSSDLLVRHPRGPVGYGPSYLHFGRRLRDGAVVVLEDQHHQARGSFCHFGLTKPVAPVRSSLIPLKRNRECCGHEVVALQKGHGPTADKEGHLPPTQALTLEHDN